MIVNLFIYETLETYSLALFNMSSTGTNEVTESFLYRAGHLAVDPRIYILIQKEVWCCFINDVFVALQLTMKYLKKNINMFMMCS